MLLMGKPSISKGHGFHSYVTNYQRVTLHTFQHVVEPEGRRVARPNAAWQAWHTSPAQHEITGEVKVESWKKLRPFLALEAP